MFSVYYPYYYSLFNSVDQYKIFIFSIPHFEQLSHRGYLVKTDIPNHAFKNYLIKFGNSVIRLILIFHLVRFVKILLEIRLLHLVRFVKILLIIRILNLVRFVKYSVRNNDISFSSFHNKIKN